MLSQFKSAIKILILKSKFNTNISHSYLKNKFQNSY